MISSLTTAATPSRRAAEGAATGAARRVCPIAGTEVAAMAQARSAERRVLIVGAGISSLTSCTTQCGQVQAYGEGVRGRDRPIEGLVTGVDEVDPDAIVLIYQTVLGYGPNLGLQIA